jgi:hypothetical protein
MSKSEIASGSPWKSDAEMTHKTLTLYHRGVSVAGLSDGEVRTLYDRYFAAPQNDSESVQQTHSSGEEQ